MGISACSNGPLVKTHFDNQVREMCATDGGVKIYQTVELPPEKFSPWGRVNFYSPLRESNALGEDYLMKTEVKWIRTDPPTLRRYHVQVFRRIDGALLGESVGYDRGGGDLIGPWSESAFSCPEKHGELVIDKIFIPIKPSGQPR